MLSDATRFPFDHIGRPDSVKQQGLAVVDMAHNRDDGGTHGPSGRCFLFAIGELEQLLQLDLLFFTRVGQLDVGPDLSGKHLDHLVTE